MAAYVEYQQPYVYFDKPNVGWSKQIEIGRQVAELGKSHFRRGFREGASRSKSSDGGGFAWRNATWGARVLQLVVIAFFIGGLIAFPWVLPFAIVLTLIIAVIYAASFGWACFMHDRWLSQCLRRFEQWQVCPKEVIHCVRCEQGLRIPVHNARLRVRCPKCRCVMEYRCGSGAHLSPEDGAADFIFDFARRMNKERRS